MPESPSPARPAGRVFQTATAAFPWLRLRVGEHAVAGADYARHEQEPVRIAYLARGTRDNQYQTLAYAQRPDGSLYVIGSARLLLTVESLGRRPDQWTRARPIDHSHTEGQS